VSADNIVGLIVSAGLIVYLVVCLIHPERF
jgi:K+-transporting ATPase KdpF subunit